MGNEYKKAFYKQTLSSVRKSLDKLTLDSLGFFESNKEEFIEIITQVESVSSELLREFPNCIEDFKLIFNDRRYNYSKNRHALLKLLDLNLELETVEETIEIMDINSIELCKSERLMTEISYPNIYTLFNLVDRENHGFGYHIHLLEKGKRTDVILLYRNDNVKDNYLYWEKHGRNRKKIVFPTSFGKKNVNEIYSKCFRFKKKQLDFRSLSPVSKILV